MYKRDPHEILERLQEKYGDVFKTSDCAKEHVTYDQLMRMIDEYLIYQYDRGLYVTKGSKEDGDDVYLFQKTHEKAIVSGVSALFLHGFSEQMPYKYEFTFPQGYNVHAVKDKPFVYKYASEPYYDFGVTEVDTIYGNTVKAYDLERCLCDIVRGKGIDLQITTQAYKSYCQYPERDFPKLMNYAKKLHVEQTVRRYLEVLQ
ncbi:MAG: type IV toxin-antitoxin system AbiEi family antitoxin domain-containing protein [Coprobacillus sp.]|nr:type IV toxin-antitoxin system AbiEi family antitoxin domain-containing protein [Coprobacillus sp.]